MTEKSLTREQILAAEDSALKKIPVKEWGGHVLIRSLTADEREEWEAFGAGKPKSGIQARLLALSIVDESGNRLFKDEDIIALGKKNGPVVNKLFRVITKMNAISEDDIEELVKNL